MPSLGARSISKKAKPLPRTRAAGMLRQWLQDGRFAASEILPTEQVLCEQLEVSRGTVRAALRQLEVEGLILSQKGPGRLRGRITAPAPALRHSLMDRVVVLITDVPKPMPYLKGGMLDSMDSGAVTAIQEAGMHLFVLHPSSITEEDLSRLIADAPLGVAVASAVADYSSKRELLLRLCGRVPLVVAGNDPLWSECDRVISDHEAGTSLLTRWLLEQGKKRILRLWTVDAVDGSGSYWLQARNRGFEKVMAAAGHPALPPVMVSDIEHSDHVDPVRFEKNVRLIAAHLIEYLVGGPPKIDAIMATSDSYAYLAAAACRLFGLRPNEDVCIVGYDNFWPAAPERVVGSFTPMATIDKQNHAVGLRMIDILQRRIAGELPAEPQCILVAPELVVPQPGLMIGRA